MPRPSGWPRGRPLRFRILAAAGILTLLLLSPLPFAGRFLHVGDPLERADAILVLAGTVAERALEAADLYRAGSAPRILLTAQAPDGGQLALEERGIHVPTNAEIARDTLVQAGVPRDAIVIFEGPHDSTADEARSLRRAMDAHGWTTAIVVTSKLHTRRARWVIRRELAGTGRRVLIRGSRYDRSDPAHWWRHRGDVRYTLFELQKFLAYALGLT